MREYKFRGKRLDNGEWLYGSLIGNDIIVGEIVEFNDEYFTTEFWYKVEPATVGQYTGLKDKNSKEIYEGDILEIITFGFNPEKFTTYIIWGNSGFKLANNRNMFYFGQKDMKRMDDARISGNIHDNPELLEG